MGTAGYVVTWCLIFLHSCSMMTTRVVASECKEGSVLCSVDCTFVQPKNIFCKGECSNLLRLGFNKTDITSSLMLQTDPPQICPDDPLVSPCVFHKVLHGPRERYQILLSLKNSNLTEEIFCLSRSFSLQGTVGYGPPTDVSLKGPDSLRGTIDVVWSFPLDYPRRSTYLRSHSYCMVRLSDGHGPWIMSQPIPKNSFFILRNMVPFSWYTVQVTCYCYFSNKFNWSENVTFVMPGLKTTTLPQPTEQVRQTTFSSQHNFTSPGNKMTSAETTPKLSGGTDWWNIRPNQTEKGVTKIYPKEPLDIRSLIPALGFFGAMLAIVCLLAAVLSLMCRKRRRRRNFETISEYLSDTECDEYHFRVKRFLEFSDPMLTDGSIGNYSDDEIKSLT